MNVQIAFLHFIATLGLRRIPNLVYLFHIESLDLYTWAAIIAASYKHGCVQQLQVLLIAGLGCASAMVLGEPVVALNRFRVRLSYLAQSASEGFKTPISILLTDIHQLNVHKARPWIANKDHN